VSRARSKIVVDLTALATPGGVRGIGRYIRELALGLSALPEDALRGLELVGLLSVDWNGDFRVTHDLGEFEDRHRASPPTGADYYSWAYRQRLALFRALRRIGADIVHICDPHATPLFLRVFGIRKIVTCHDLVPTRYPEHYMGLGDGGPFIGKLIERRRYTGADLVIAVSEATKHDVRTLLGVPESRVVRVYNGMDVGRWAAEPPGDGAAVLRRLGILEPYALYAGGSDFRKNVEGMLGGIAAARAAGVDLTLAWAGNLEPRHRAAVEARVHAAKLSSAVRLLGFVSDTDLAHLYRRALAHLFVSRLEGFGFTVVEAMASGCPIVTTQGGSLGEVAGDAALTVDPEDPVAIGGALVRLAREPALRSELEERGRRRAPRFSREAQARGTLEAYRKLAEIDAPG